MRNFSSGLRLFLSGGIGLVSLPAGAAAKGQGGFSLPTSDRRLSVGAHFVPAHAADSVPAFAGPSCQRKGMTEEQRFSVVPCSRFS